MTASSNIQSIVTFKNSQGESARGTILRLSRSTVVFEVYNPYSIVQLSEVLQNFTVRRGDRPIYTGRAVVSNLVNTGLMLIVSVNLIDAWSDLFGLLETRRGIGDEVRRFIQDFDSISGVRSGYQLIVATLRNFLSELGRWLEQVDLDAGIALDNSHDLSEEVFYDIADPLFPRLSQLFQSFEEEARAVPEEALSHHKAYAQRDLHPLLLRAPFVHRTFTKPLGYAGDYEMVNMMVRNMREGPNSYAQLLHGFYVNAKTCQAHRNRILIMTHLLKEVSRNSTPQEQVRILNVGCGPAHEVLNFIMGESHSERCSIELIDFSQETLQATRENIMAVASESRKLPQLEYIQESIHNLLKSAARPESSGRRAQYDYIYCAGLFDYLSDKVCSRLFTLFCQWTKPGGLVVATNVHSSNEYRCVMEHILDWYLIHRDEARMESLAPAAGRKKIYTDETGMNVFLEMRIATSRL